MLLQRPCRRYNMCLSCRCPTHFSLGRGGQTCTRRWGINAGFFSQYTAQQVSYHLTLHTKPIDLHTHSKCCGNGNVLKLSRQTPLFCSLAVWTSSSQGTRESILFFRYQMDLSSKRALCVWMTFWFLCTETWGQTHDLVLVPSDLTRCKITICPRLFVLTVKLTQQETWRLNNNQYYTGWHHRWSGFMWNVSLKIWGWR